MKPMTDEQLVKDAEEWLADVVPRGKTLFVNAICMAYLSQRKEIRCLREENEGAKKLNVEMCRTLTLKQAWGGRARELLLLLLDSVDYTDRGNACLPTEMVGACLPKVIIEKIRAFLDGESNSDNNADNQVVDGFGEKSL